MCQRTATALVIALVAAAPCVARSKAAAAVEAANAVKAGFHARGEHSVRGPGPVGVANRTLKVVVAAVLTDGTLAIHTLDGESLGTLDPFTIPELVARDKTRFGGRRHLEISDLEAGQRLKLTFRGNTSEILRAKVLRAPGASPQNSKRATPKGGP